MSNNNNKAVCNNRELTLLLGTYWFDFEQAAELINTAVAHRRAECPSEETKVTEELFSDYAI